MLSVTTQVLLSSSSVVFICETDPTVIPAHMVVVKVESKRGTWHLICGKHSINAISESVVEGGGASFRFA